MISIQTKYLPVTNVKGSRIKAFTCNGHSVTIPYPHEFSGHLCHFQAVKALAKKCKVEWELDKMRYGGTKQGYVFCFADSIVEESEGKLNYSSLTSISWVDAMTSLIDRKKTEYFRWHDSGDLQS